MDFRTCPACHASVLEDDATECPFCGASMSGKPKPAPIAKSSSGSSGAKAAGPSAGGGKSASPAASKGAAPAKKAVRPSAPAKAERSESGEEDPFEVDTTAVRRAIKLAPRPTKSRTLAVTCPMCETTGYMPPSEAGKDVHCCNPECMVPVFKSPRPVVEEEPEEEPKSNKLLWSLGGVAALALIGVGVWFFVFAEKEKQQVVDNSQPAQTNRQEELQKLTPRENAVVRQTQAAPVSNEEIRAQVLRQVVDRSRSRERNRLADYGTQMAAEIFAESGDLDQAQQQIRRLQQSSAVSGAPYMLIPPMIEIGWTQLAQGNATAAQTTVENALGRAKNLPLSIRRTHDIAIELAALLIAVDKEEDAENLLRTASDRSQRGVASTLWRASIDSRSFDMEQEFRRPWHLAMPDPTRIGVVEALVGHGQVDAALSYLMGISDQAARDAALAAWAARTVQQNPQGGVARVTSALQANGLTEASRARAWAAVASVSQSERAAALERAISALSSVTPKGPIPLPSKRAIYNSEGKRDLGLGDTSPILSEALAAADIASVQLLTGDQAAAWSSYKRALELARGISPGADAVEQLVQENSNSETLVRRELDQQLGLNGNDTRIRPAFLQYRRQVGSLQDLALSRLRFQAEILRSAAQKGLLQQTWDYAAEQRNVADVAAREPYFKTNFPSLAYSLAREAKNESLMTSIRSAQDGFKPELIDEYYAALDRVVGEGNYREASEILKRGYRSPMAKEFPDRTDVMALRMSSRIQSAKSPRETMDFIEGLYDPVIQEDAFLQLAGNSVVKGNASEVWKVTSANRDLDALEHVSLYRGFVAAMPRAGRATTAPSTSTSTDSTSAE